MNFLAHLFLSGEDDDIAFGNFIADDVKGNSLGHFSPKIVRGIRLHREIDHFTDNHPVFRQSKARVMPKYGKYSGIVIDLYYDHFLAKNWPEYSEVRLGSYVAHAYALLIKRYLLLPPRSRRILPYMVAQNWLTGYANFNSLQRVFNGMSRRTNYQSGMETAISELKEHYEQFGDEFRSFFPQLIAHSSNFLDRLNSREES